MIIIYLTPIHILVHTILDHIRTLHLNTYLWYSQLHIFRAHYNVVWLCPTLLNMHTSYSGCRNPSTSGNLYRWQVRQLATFLPLLQSTY